MRVDGDTWDITSSVGATALGVAAARATETLRADPLISDPFARILVEATGKATGWERFVAGDIDWPDPEAGRIYGRMVDYQATRTHFFDAYFLAAAAAGVRQIVILASGLDSRAYRLDWPAGTTVYEIDQPQVLEFKAAALAAHQPTAQRRGVAVDLRADWPAVLRSAGFDSTQPTAWLAEGLLPYLPADAQDSLFINIGALSAPGSRIAVEGYDGKLILDESEEEAARREQVRAAFKTAVDVDVTIENLIYEDENRADPAEWLEAHGWSVTKTDAHDEMARLGRPVPEDIQQGTFRGQLIQGELR
ncbi:class I SAM-dependent methyltransferase [Mycobacteroides franklinii]|uniref:S-adenosyl-L-methionine-dependent methyltransferase n=1 Tax=Mycobacteroides franklinii TaxID=948102 RepID=A0A4V3HVA4_9MYCO|nr:class I SAM-dependent methyltransferase [Mycobacteroides franklinii]TDZ44280.1 putative S-adenosyl-L-methionine-dependent methyltransferase [Mycobacteroides franklinii]TDZ51413.1 putative S-adenosyl-L-methionine-dependent methyltransferase [Mycobacteroides franklinii]TDZ57834.1 putative S-adenosyl-L-methionine-dependent methyltransferase [Mycobacteroides franklinii]TDZ64775.1 putative S-adenosyl-L-methionine-dependent methyltransferase [Mycobacteroides franklinii]TDZ71173.1 putative S-adeno